MLIGSGERGLCLDWCVFSGIFFWCNTKRSVARVAEFVACVFSPLEVALVLHSLKVRLGLGKTRKAKASKNLTWNPAGSGSC